MGTLLFKKTPTKMQDAYSVAAIKRKTQKLEYNVDCDEDIEP